MRECVFDERVRGRGKLCPMKTFFAKVHCPDCHQAHDPTERRCPHCGHFDQNDRYLHDFDHQFRDLIPWQISYFLIGYAGFQLISLIHVIIGDAILVGTNPGLSPEEISSLAKGTPFLFWVSATSYIVLAFIFLLMLGLGRRLPRLFRSFANWKSMVAGVVGFVAITGITLLYGLLIPATNANQSSIVAMVKYSPVFAIVVFGVIGPFCEEMGYRVGLFGFASRLGKVAAYIITPIVFGLIHFNWGALFGGDTNAMVTELIAIPNYIGAGAALCFLYDRFGFGAAFVAHSLNNVFSCLQILWSAQ